LAEENWFVFAVAKTEKEKLFAHLTTEQEK